MNILELNAVDLNKSVQKREVSCVEIAEAYAESIEKNEKKINAYITLNDDFIESAKRLDQKIASGEGGGILAGVPVGVKDNIMTKGMRTTCASKMLKDFVPPFDATVVKKLKDEDSLIVGKTNMDEYAVGGSNENSYFGPVHNPVDLERVPGGSSGGSAAAVAGGEALVSLGSDTGGSIRQPASFCGIVGIKPTYGLVSRYGVTSMANTLDQVGTFGRDVRDAFYLLKGISGRDFRDPTSVPNHALADVDFTQSYEELLEESMERIRGMKIAIPREYFTDDLNPDIKNQVMRVVETYDKLGARVGDVRFPHLEYGLPAYYAIAPSELSTTLARFDGMRFGNRADQYESVDEMFKKTRDDGFGEEVKRRILIGTYCTQGGFAKSYYRKALQARTLIVKDLLHIFEEYDLILSPTTPTLPFKVGEKSTDPISMYLADSYTVPLNLAGICGVSIPCGEVHGLPVGFQLMADRFEESKLFYSGIAYEGGRR